MIIKVKKPYPRLKISLFFSNETLKKSYLTRCNTQVNCFKAINESQLECYFVSINQIKNHSH